MSGFAKDLRDANILGILLLEGADEVRRTYGREILITDVYDIHVKHLDVPNYKGEMMGYYTTKAYLDELSNRTDRYAQSTLEAIKLGAKPNPIDAEIV